MQSRLLLIALGATLFGAQGGSAQDSDDKKFYVNLEYSRLGSDLLEINSVDSSIEFGRVG